MDYYLEQELVECNNPTFTELNNSPICNLGNGEKTIELHFLHYSSFLEAKTAWDKRKSRINKKNIFVLLAAFNKVEEKTVARFEKLAFENKVFIIERPLPQYKSTYYIKGYEKDGLKTLNSYCGMFGKRIYDYFDFVNWLNTGKF